MPKQKNTNEMMHDHLRSVSLKITDFTEVTKSFGAGIAILFFPKQVLAGQISTLLTLVTELHEWGAETESMP
jgi:hypothetical protein